jgi:hypothetical protein
MTNNQLIAMLFALGTAVSVGLTALLVKWWVDRKYKAEKAKERALKSPAGAIELDAIDLLTEESSLIQKAQRQIQQKRKQFDQRQ